MASRYTKTARKANLIKLATYLESLPEDYAYFNMSTFLESYGNNEKLVDYVLNNGGVHKCGTAACAVGHGPAAGILFHEDELTRVEYWNETERDYVLSNPQPDWDAYTERFVDIGSDELEFLFGGSWSWADDSHQGAARRIRYYLAKGVPEEFLLYDDGKKTIEVVNEFCNVKA